ncbi:MarR family transcriptional regulator [Limibacter armeniacum]|uniref:MarR family winged helix-turn-helix transcriptional regulator n=1 Tax=Limibacter armeniacum TaxID=466084 RepID=UPI002FE5EE7B
MENDKQETCEWLKLDNQLCFQLYALSRKITQLYGPMLKKLDITYPQYLIFLVMWEHKELSIKEIGSRLHLDTGTLTPMLKRMEQKGWLTRQRDKQDERVVKIALTESGWSLQPKAVDIPKDLVCAMHLDLEEAAQMRETLKALMQKL